MNQPILLFDGVCNLCNPLVNFILRKEADKTILFVPLQSALAGKIMKRYSIPVTEQNFETIIFIESNKVWVRSDAVFKVISHLRKPYSVFSIFEILPHRLSDGVYNLISKNRYKIFGKSETCMIPDADMLHRFPTEL